MSAVNDSRDSNSPDRPPALPVRHHASVPMGVPVLPTVPNTGMHRHGSLPIIAGDQTTNTSTASTKTGNAATAATEHQQSPSPLHPRPVQPWSKLAPLPGRLSAPLHKVMDKATSAMQDVAKRFVAPQPPDYFSPEMKVVEERKHIGWSSV
jgi:hypothetical protein